MTQYTLEGKVCSQVNGKRQKRLTEIIFHRICPSSFYGQFEPKRHESLVVADLGGDLPEYKSITCLLGYGVLHPKGIFTGGCLLGRMETAGLVNKPRRLVLGKATRGGSLPSDRS